MAADVMPAELQAARFAGNLWAAICAAGPPHAPGHQARHLAGALDAAWLASLPLPAGSTGQPASRLPHVASTPADPGHSVHLAFAIDRDEFTEDTPDARSGRTGRGRPRDEVPRRETR